MLPTTPVLNAHIRRAAAAARAAGCKSAIRASAPAVRRRAAAVVATWGGVLAIVQLVPGRRQRRGGPYHRGRGRGDQGGGGLIGGGSKRSPGAGAGAGGRSVVRSCGAGALFQDAIFNAAFQKSFLLIGAVFTLLLHHPHHGLLLEMLLECIVRGPQNLPVVAEHHGVGPPVIWDLHLLVKATFSPSRCGQEVHPGMRLLLQQFLPLCHPPPPAPPQRPKSW
mmetsp:Transcript_43389/g.111720  ORF Transcript_43389/g.111720 Transcript_43389/m.111720 type:complete len:222 (-) Transcript_43389:369-1034(-)